MKIPHYRYVLFGLGVLALVCAVSGDARAQGRIKFHHFGRYDVPPRVYGYKLDEDVAGYYGGIRYREYYNFGRGYGAADYPGTLPNYHGDYLPHRYWPYPSYLSPQVATLDPCEAYICVNVPADAEVFLEGQATTQLGEKRYFKSPPLATDQRFLYEVRARWQENGQPREQIQNIEIQGGNFVQVSFPQAATTQPEASPPPLLTAPPIAKH
jgi:uncharacterized protein (TIGR03000 family)